MTLEQFTAHRRRWRLAKFFEIAMTHNHRLLTPDGSPNAAMKAAKGALATWERENPNEYAEEFEMESGK